MYNLLLVAALATSAAGPIVQPTAAPAVSASAEKDIQCLTLAFLAAGTEKDKEKQQAAIAASWYFLGRADIEAPGIDLHEATLDALKRMKGDPRTKEIGSYCDTQFSTRASDLVKMGHQGNP